MVMVMVWFTADAHSYADGEADGHGHGSLSESVDFKGLIHEITPNSEEESLIAVKINIYQNQPDALAFCKFWQNSFYNETGSFVSGIPRAHREPPLPPQNLTKLKSQNVFLKMYFFHQNVFLKVYFSKCISHVSSSPNVSKVTSLQDCSIVSKSKGVWVIKWVSKGRPLER